MSNKKDNEQSSNSDMHEAFANLHFEDNEMDFAFSVILGATMNKGCEIGEAFYTAAKIEEGVAASWQKEWIEMAERVGLRGEQSLTRGHEVSARNQFMRASNYYRAGVIDANKDFTFDPTKVKCPALIIVGEGEFNNSEEVQKQQRECYEKLPNPLKRFVITPSDEGAANHCILENRSVMSQVVFDWLDDVFEK